MGALEAPFSGEIRIPSIESKGACRHGAEARAACRCKEEHRLQMSVGFKFQYIVLDNARFTKLVKASFVLIYVLIII